LTLFHHFHHVAKAMKDKKKVSSEKGSLAEDIKETVAELQLVCQGKLETRNARDLVDVI
jgi:hypothetical protein